MVRSTGIALLAARPAKRLPIVCFANELVEIKVCLGKTFRSRETAPSLNSCRYFVTYKKGNPLRVSFFVVRSTGICPLGRASSLTCFAFYSFFRQSVLLPQNGSSRASCSLRSVTFTPTYRRSLISHLQDVINALLNGQLVPQIPSWIRIHTNEKMHLDGCIFSLVRTKGFEPSRYEFRPYEL